jgi:uncharacterized membrane protein YheB (UPF0754 family)
MEFSQQIVSLLENIYFQVGLLVFVATFHGYGAAWLAVRMLFRPRRPVKFLGITVFPQGMIPRHRARLAEAIGKAVGEELVSPETILAELFEKDFLRRKIEDTVNSYTQEFLQRDYPSVTDMLPENLRESVLEAVFSLQLKVAEHIEFALQSEETLETIRGFIERRSDDILSRRVSELVDDETAEKILNFLETRIRSAVREPEFHKKIHEFISNRIDDLINTKTPLNQMITDDAIGLLKEKATAQIEPIAHQLAELATAERTRKQISAIIKHEVHDYYEQLPFFKKFFVSRENLLGEVDDLVNESLPKRIEETLRGEVFAEEAGNFISDAIDNALAKPLPEVVGTIETEQLENLKKQISDGVFSFIQSDETMKTVSAYLTDGLEKLKPHSLRAIMQTAHPESEDKLKNMLSKGLMGLLSREENFSLINTFLASQIDKLLSAPIGKLSNHLSEDKIKTAGSALTTTIIDAAKAKLPEAIKEFDVGTMVKERVNNFPVEKLESLILSVAKEHLRTIELFGAGFGFVIGVVQGILHYYFAKGGV